MPYIALFLCLLGCIYIYDIRRYGRGRNVAFLMLLVAFTAMAGFRYRLGYDTTAYEEYYQMILDGAPVRENLQQRIGPGFRCLFHAMAAISLDFIWIQILTAAIINVAVFRFARGFAKNLFLFLTFYFIFLYFQLSFQVIREAMAVSILLISWPSVVKGKWLHYYLLAAVALVIHHAAVFMLFLPVCFLPRVRNLFRLNLWALPMIAASVLAGVIFNRYFAEIMNAVASLSPSMKHFGNIYSDTMFSGMILNWKGVTAKVILRMIYPAAALFLLLDNQRRKASAVSGVEKIEEQSQYLGKLEIMVMAGIYISAAAIPVHILSRYIDYMAFFMLLPVANAAFSDVGLLKRFRRQSDFIWTLALIPFLFLGIYNFFTPEESYPQLRHYRQYHPYSSRLNPVRDEQRERLYRAIGD